MALAEPALRQFGFRKLQNLRIRGGSLIGTAIGTAIGIGYGLTKDYEIGWPGKLQPDRPYRGVPTLNGVSQTPYGSAYQYSQALRRATKFSTRSRSRYNSRNRRCCCCSC